ncbi:MAG: hypothetical protein ABFS46_05750 [Myxococcota bacterium]
MDEPSRRILDGTTWEEFCDTLKAAGSVVLGEGSPENPFDRAEGFRYLSRLTRSALESFVENADPLAPELRRTAHETIKMGADNPDNHYQNAPISGKCEYRIHGTRGSVHYLGLGTQAGNYGSTGTLETTGYLDHSDIALGPDGGLEVFVSCDPKPQNWLPMKPDSRTLIVRQTFLDKASETPAQLRIERIDGPHAARPVTPASIDRGLTNSARFVMGCARIFHQWALGFQKHVNQLPRFDDEVARRAGGDPNIVYYHSYWELEPDEALVIEVTPPECEHWNFQLNNHWMESLDYRYFPVWVNKHSARTREDGSVQVVVAHRDPGTSGASGPMNWIDTCGHHRGTMCWRWIRATEHPEPGTRVVKLAALQGS